MRMSENSLRMRFDEFYILSRSKLICKLLTRVGIPEGRLFLNRLEGRYTALGGLWLFLFFSDQYAPLVQAR